MEPYEFYVERGIRLVKTLQGLKADDRIFNKMQTSKHFQAVVRDNRDEPYWTEEEAYLTSYGVSGPYLDRYRILANLLSSYLKRMPDYENIELRALIHEVLDSWETMFREDNRRLLKEAIDDVRGNG